MGVDATRRLLLTTLPAVALGHGALVTPPSRNALDRFLPAFTHGKVPSTSCSCNVRRQLVNFLRTAVLFCLNMQRASRVTRARSAEIRNRAAMQVFVKAAVVNRASGSVRAAALVAMSAPALEATPM